MACKVSITLFAIYLFTFLTIIKCQITSTFTIEKINKTESHLLSFAEIPSLDLDYKEEERTTTELCLGTPPQCFKLIIQTNSFYIWVSDGDSKVQKSVNKFHAKNSSTLSRKYTEITSHYYENNVTGIEGEDILSIKGQEIGKVKFLLVSKSHGYKKVDGMIGLGYLPSINEKKFSIIEQLHKAKLIHHKVFAQKYLTSTTGEFTIGEIPKYIVEDYTHYGRCRAMDKVVDGRHYKNKNWQCELKALNFGNNFNPSKLYSLKKKKVSFLEFRKRTLIPKFVFDYLRTKYFKKAIDSGKCEIKKKKRYSMIVCSQDFNVQNLNIVLGDWVMTIPNKKLWKPLKNGTKEFILYQKSNYDKFIIGRSILMHFHMVYDTQNKQIGFYGPTVQYIGNKKVSKPKTYHQLLDDVKSVPVKPDKPTPSKPIQVGEIEPKDEGTKTIEINNKRSFSTAFILQVVLVFFIVLGVFVILLFALYSYVRYRRKTKFKNRDFYVKKTEAFLASAQTI